jgi:hypothetical protein
MHTETDRRVPPRGDGAATSVPSWTAPAGARVPRRQQSASTPASPANSIWLWARAKGPASVVPGSWACVGDGLRCRQCGGSRALSVHHPVIEGATECLDTELRASPSALKLPQDHDTFTSTWRPRRGVPQQQLAEKIKPSSRNDRYGHGVLLKERTGTTRSPHLKPTCHADARDPLRHPVPFAVLRQERSPLRIGRDYDENAGGGDKRDR